MKFAMTGSLILGTRDGANIEIAREVGEENIFFFGTEINNVDEARAKMKNSLNSKVDLIGAELRKVFKFILGGKFGDISFLKEYIANMINGGDWYLVCHDFYPYIEAQQKVDEAYSDLTEWYKKALICISKMGYFSSDRSIQDYSERIWKLKPVEVPGPTPNASTHIVSSCTQNFEKIDNKSSKKSKSHTYFKDKFKPSKKDKIDNLNLENSTKENELEQNKS